MSPVGYSISTKRTWSKMTLAPAAAASLTIFSALSCTVVLQASYAPQALAQGRAFPQAGMWHSSSSPGSSRGPWWFAFVW